ncbi:MAG TPA: hypothetical protein VGE69_17205 [Pseudomonadales bacterium]
MPKEALDEEDRSLLAPSELAALEDDDDADNDPPDGEDDQDDDAADDDSADDADDDATDKAGKKANDKGGKADDDAGAGDKKKTDEPAPGKKDEGAGDDDDAVVQPDTRLPQYQINPDELKKAKEVVDGIEARFDDLAKRFHDGDIDEAAYAKENRALQREERAAQKIVDRAEIYEEVNRTNANETWEAAQDSFFARPENKILEDELVMPMMQVALNQVRAKPDAEGKPYSWHLSQAAKIVKAKIGYVEAPPITRKNTPAQDELNKRQQRRQDPPQTLAHKPAADDNAAEYTGKFAHLSGLTGMELEEAVAGLSEADQKEWAEKA